MPGSRMLNLLLRRLDQLDVPPALRRHRSAISPGKAYRGFYHLHSTQVAKESEACATSILVRLRKKMTIKSRMTKALKAEVVQKARQFRTITPLTLEVK